MGRRNQPWRRRSRLYVLCSVFAILLALGPAVGSSTDSPPCSSVPILMYHKVVSQKSPSVMRVAPAVFEAQISHLQQKGYHTITVGQWIDHLTQGRPLPERPIIITFDDGYLDNYQNALPILSKAGYVATIFVTAGKLGKTIKWADEQGRPAARVVTATQLRKLAAAGWEVGSHTLTHPKLDAISDQKRQRELVESRRVLEQIISKPVRSFSYPDGKYDESTVTAVRAAGYHGAVTTDPGNNSCVTDLFHLNRWRVDGTKPLGTFFSKFP